MKLTHTTLAWQPFLEPLNLHAHWLWLLPPLVFAIALVYKTLRMHTLDHLLNETLRLTAFLLFVAAAAAASLWALVEIV